MLIGVKFCGGCNEGYDRGQTFEQLRNYFKGRVDFEYVKDKGSYDALLLMSGCLNRCASIDGYDYNDRLVSVWKLDRAENAIQQIEEYLKE